MSIGIADDRRRLFAGLPTHHAENAWWGQSVEAPGFPNAAWSNVEAAMLAQTAPPAIVEILRTEALRDRW
jgi:hypothetical protein